MVILKNVKFYSVITGLIIGAIVWKGIVIDTYPKSDSGSLWAIWGVTFLAITYFYLQNEIGDWLNKRKQIVRGKG